MSGKENRRYFSYFHFILFIVQRKEKSTDHISIFLLSKGIKQEMKYTD